MYSTEKELEESEAREEQNSVNDQEMAQRYNISFVRERQYKTRSMTQRYSISLVREGLYKTQSMSQRYNISLVRKGQYKTQSMAQRYNISLVRERLYYITSSKTELWFREKSFVTCFSPFVTFTQTH